MDNAWKQMIEGNIQEYISKVDFKNPDFSINELKIELGKLIGIKPAIELKWKTTEKVNELLKNSGAIDFIEKTEKLEQINITFVDVDNTPIQFKYLI